MVIQTVPQSPKTRSLGRDRATAVGPDTPLEGPGRRASRRQAAPDPLHAAESNGRAYPGLERPGNETRTRRLPEQRLVYVHDPGFDDPDAGARYLSPLPPSALRAPAGPGPATGRSPYLASLYGNAPLLRPEEEANLFLKMNYLKYRASKLLAALDPSRARAPELDEIDRLQAEARAVKDRI